MATKVLGNCTGTILYDFSNVGSIIVAPSLETRVRWEIIDQNWAERYTDIKFYLEVRYNQAYDYILKNGASITVGYNPTSGIPDDGNKTFLEMTEKNVHITNEWTVLIQGTHRFTGAKHLSNGNYASHYMQVEVMLGIDMQYSLIDWAHVRGCSPIPTLHSVDQTTWNDAENPSFKVLIPSLDYFTKEYSDIYPTGLTYFFGDKKYLLRYDNINTASLALGVHHYTFNLTEAERQSIYESMGTGLSRTYQFSVIATLRQPTVGIYETVQTVKMELTDSEPVINPEVVDINPVSVALTGNSFNLIRHVSNAQASINAEAQKLSTLTRIEIVNGDAISVVDSDVVIFEKVEYGKFYFMAQDNRNLVKQKTLNPTFIEYIPMTCTIASESTTGDGQMKLIARGNYWIGNFGQVDNFVEVYYRYKKSGESEFSEWTLFSAIDSFSETNTYEAYEYFDNLDYQATYTFECYATDATGEQVFSASKTISTLPIFDWGQRDFNFNVPVTIEGQRAATVDQIISRDEMQTEFDTFREEMNVVKEDTAAISDRLIRALGSYEELSSSVTTLNAIVSKPVFIATLIGNNLHLSFSSESSGDQWNNYAEGIDILSIELTNDGKITYMAPAIISNGLVTLETTDIEVDEDYITFNLHCKEVTNGTTYFAQGHGVSPVAINVNKF